MSSGPSPCPRSSQSTLSLSRHVLLLAEQGGSYSRSTGNVDLNDLFGEFFGGGGFGGQQSRAQGADVSARIS